MAILQHQRCLYNQNEEGSKGWNGKLESVIAWLMGVLWRIFLCIRVTTFKRYPIPALKLLQQNNIHEKKYDDDDDNDVDEILKIILVGVEWWLRIWNREIIIIVFLF